MILLVVILIAFFAYYRINMVPIKIGFVASLTGELSELGVTGRNGAMIAVEELNQKSGFWGKKLQLVVEDDKNRAEEALQADIRLHEQGVEIVVGHMISAMTKTSLPFANQKKMLMISPTISTDKLTGIDDYFIRVIPANSNEGKKLALAAGYRTSARKIAVICDQRNMLYAEPIIKVFAEQLATFSGQIVKTITFKNQKELIVAAKQINADEIEGVLIIASALDASLLCQQLRINKIKLPVFLPMWAMTNDFIQAGGRSVENAYLVSKVDLNSQEIKYQNFVKKYYEKYKEKPNFPAILSYNAVLVVAEGINSANSANGTKVRTAILSRGRFPGLQGEQIIDKYGDMQSEYFLYQVQNGFFVKVEDL